MKARKSELYEFLGNSEWHGDGHFQWNPRWKYALQVSNANGEVTLCSYQAYELWKALNKVFCEKCIAVEEAESESTED